MKGHLVGLVLFGFLAACSGSAPEANDESANDESASDDSNASTTKRLATAQLPNGSTSESNAGTDVTGFTGTGGSNDVTGAMGTGGTSAALSKERALATKLGAPSRFLVGLGNDPNGNGSMHRSGYELGSNIDVHYMYLSGLGWTTWNSPAGAYVGLEAAAAKAHGAIPMFTLYQAAEHGDGNLAPFATDDFMTKYWANVRILFAQLDAFGDGAIVHVEPDFWGYAQKTNGAAANTPVKVNNLVAECKDLPNDVSGFGRCIIRLSRQLAPNVAIGLSASAWGKTSSGVSQPTEIAAFMKSVGGDQADLLVIETLDRDAGCFEAGTDPSCKRSGAFYWTQQNFADHLAWAKTMHEQTGLPLLWWQMPLGVPSSTPGGTSGHYRDNRVQYLFSHPEQFVAAGGIGAVFGTGAANQTTVETDGGQFKKALSAYLAKPVALP